MIATGYFTRRDLALIVGLDLMETSLPEIAEELGRSELDVATALGRARSMIRDPLICGALKARPLLKPDTKASARRPPVRRVPSPIGRPVFPGAPVSVTAALMGDPAPGRSALDHSQKETAHGPSRERNPGR